MFVRHKVQYLIRWYCPQNVQGNNEKVFNLFSLRLFRQLIQNLIADNYNTFINTIYVAYQFSRYILFSMNFCYVIKSYHSLRFAIKCNGNRFFFLAYINILFIFLRFFTSPQICLVSCWTRGHTCTLHMPTPFWPVALLILNYFGTYSLRKFAVCGLRPLVVVCSFIFAHTFIMRHSYTASFNWHLFSEQSTNWKKVLNFEFVCI